MKIGLAQIQSVDGDVAQNIEHHLQILTSLSAENLELVVFPELSLSNYEPGLAADAAITPNDERLQPLQAFAADTGMVIVVGAPLRTSNKPLIAALAIFPQQEQQVIGKTYLHEDEIPFFTAAESPVGVLSMAKRVAVAICHEINVEAHIQAAAAGDMQLYLASVAKTAAGIQAAETRLSMQAKRFNVPILVANSVGTCEGKVAGGRSMIIAASGRVLGALDDTEESVLIYDVVTQAVGKKTSGF